MDIAQKAPVAIFAYNRLWNTREVITALQKNHLAGETDVFIYSDASKGPRQQKGVAAVRSYLKTITGFKSVTIIEREHNYYIEQNIIQGVTEMVTRFGNVIVLEDDGVTSPHFLTFMNDALTFYADKKKVMHIGTFTFIDMPEGFNETFFWRYTENTGGGWGTWSDRWDKFQYFQNEEDGLASLTPEQQNSIQLDGSFTCLNSLKSKPIPWDICWYMTLVRNDGLAVNSPWALTVNNGLYNGTHFTAMNRLLGESPFTTSLSHRVDIVFSDTIVENELALKKLKTFYEKLGKRFRDRTWYYFVRMLVFLKVTKVLKYFFK